MVGIYEEKLLFQTSKTKRNIYEREMEEVKIVDQFFDVQIAKNLLLGKE